VTTTSGRSRLSCATTCCDRRARIGAIERLIVVVEHRHFAHAANGRRRAQLLLADLRQRRRAWMPIVAGTMAVEAAALAACRRQQEDLDAFRGVFRQRAAHAQIVGMREHRHQIERRHESVILRRSRRDPGGHEDAKTRRSATRVRLKPDTAGIPVKASLDVNHCAIQLRFGSVRL